MRFTRIYEILDKHRDNPDLLKKIKIILDRFYVGRKHIMNTRIYGRLADLTQYVNYDCKIDKDGHCKQYPDRNSRCCCRQCAYSVGHFQSSPINFKYPRGDTEEIILKYAELFDLKDGFWREGKGCTLPRYMRSSTCLTHNCSHPTLTLEEKALLSILADQQFVNNTTNPIIEILEKHFKGEKDE